MRNVTKKLVNSYWELLNGSLSVPVYIESVPESETGNYVLLRVEGETNVDENAKTWIKEIVVILDIVTVFDNMIDTSVVDDIDAEIGVLLAATPYSGHNLAAQTGMQINRVTDESSEYLQEDDGTYKYYRKITRYNNLITVQN